MESEADRWVDTSPEHRLELARERLIVAVTEEIWGAMEREGVSNVDLAQKLGTGKSYISQLLTGARNMTLKTIADVAAALGQNVTISFVEQGTSQDWTSHDLAVRPALREQFSAAPLLAEAVNDNRWFTIETDRQGNG